MLVALWGSAATQLFFEICAKATATMQICSCWRGRSFWCEVEFKYHRGLDATKRNLDIKNVVGGKKNCNAVSEIQLDIK